MENMKWQKCGGKSALGSDETGRERGKGSQWIRAQMFSKHTTDSDCSWLLLIFPFSCPCCFSIKKPNSWQTHAGNVCVIALVFPNKHTFLFLDSTQRFIKVMRGCYGSWVSRGKTILTVMSYEFFVFQFSIWKLIKKDFFLWLRDCFIHQSQTGLWVWRKLSDCVDHTLKQCYIWFVWPCL